MIKKNIKKSLPSLLKILCSASTQSTQNNCVSPNKGPIKKFLLQNFTIYALVTVKKYCNQNRSPKNSHACVPLNHAPPPPQQV
jgi:hypothetical protein